MADDLHPMALLRRIIHEHRRAIVPLAAILGINVALYATVVFPLARRVANIEERDRNAENQLRAAELEHGQASGTLTGKDRASTELATFYRDVLPSDLAGARRLTHLRLAQLARQSNLEFLHASFEPVLEKGMTLTRLKIEMALAGSYSDMRSFIHELETSPEFVVIDNVELQQGADAGPLSVTLRLSTYYRDTAARAATP